MQVLIQENPTLSSTLLLKRLFNEKTCISHDYKEIKVVGYDVVAGASAQNMMIARTELEKLLRPSDNNSLNQFITKLWLATQSEALGNEEKTLKFQVYKELLITYPKDILDDFAKEWPLTNKFFPKVAEIIEVIGPKHKERLMKLDAIQTALYNFDKPKITAQQPKIDPDPDAEARDLDERRKTGLLFKLYRLGYFNKNETEDIKKFKNEFIAQDYDICVNIVSKYEQSIFEVTL